MIATLVVYNYLAGKTKKLVYRPCDVIRETIMKLCLTIGISKAHPLSHLPGAITAAHEIRDWASQAGFITEVITDEGETPVTIARIRETLLKMLPANDEVDLFVLHFAGHGFRTGAEQNVWLPSDWHKEMRAISVEALKRQLYMHGIKSLSIFADACRSLPSDIETADIFGDPVLPRGPYEAAAPIIDRFNAVADGQQAFMLKGDGTAPARCVFSTVLVEGLSGFYDESFDKYLPDCVIPESLALFSKKRLKEIGEKYDLRFSPDFGIGIPREHAVYYQRDGKPNELVLPKWPAPPSQDKVPDKASRDFRASLPVNKSRTFEQPFPDTLPGIDDYCAAPYNLIICGAVPKKIWSTSSVELSPFDEKGMTYTVHVPAERNPPPAECAVQILVEFDTGLFVSAVVYHSLITVLNRDNNGAFNWTCVSEWGGIRQSLRDSSAAVANLQTGNLNADQVDGLAALLRHNKHANPTLGAIASYLYDYTGDIDSIRRMAYFYCHYSQPMPFDVAFMGLLSMEENVGKTVITAKVPIVSARSPSPANAKLPHWVTRGTTEEFGQVAGLWPWLRQGWEFMEDPEPQECMAAEGLRDAAKFLLPSQFSSFKEQGARILIEKFHLEASE